MQKADKVTIRLTAEQAEALDYLVGSGQYKNRSTALRAALDNFIARDQEAVSAAPELSLPDTMTAEIETLVSLEYFPSFELGLREMVRNQLEKIDVNSVKERKQLRDEMLAEKKAKDIMEDVYTDYVKQ
ncbi:MAG: ribbon-helix-helix domain-containing protein [Thermoplasmatota archaeon]